MKQDVRTILITGGRGYVGGRLAQALAADPTMDLRLGTRRPGARPAWLERGRLVAFDMSDDAALDTACGGVDTVVHLAAVNEIVSGADPEAALLLNSLGTLKVLRAAERAGVRRLIFFSTAHVYGTPLQGVITERTLARPIHPYAITHRVAEDFVLASHDSGRIEGVVVRLSNSFGAPAHPDVDRWTLLVNDLCRQAVVEGVLTLRSSGLQWRDFIPLEDVARATKHLMAIDRIQLSDGLFNLGGKRAIRVIDFARKVSRRAEAVLGRPIEIRRPEPAPGDDGETPLDYRIDRLEASGFRLAGDVDAEIDATLRMCQRAFGTS